MGDLLRFPVERTRPPEPVPFFGVRLRPDDLTAPTGKVTFVIDGIEVEGPVVNLVLGPNGFTPVVESGYAPGA